MPSSQLRVSESSPNVSTVVERLKTTNRVVARSGDDSRDGSNWRVGSTSWGSLVRTQYRPSLESPARAGFVYRRSSDGLRDVLRRGRSAGSQRAPNPALSILARRSSRCIAFRTPRWRLGHSTTQLRVRRVASSSPVLVFSVRSIDNPATGGYGRGSNGEGVGLPSNRPTEVAAAQKALAGWGLEGAGLGRIKSAVGSRDRVGRLTAGGSGRATGLAFVGAPP